ncbi:hypothetical protein Tco_0719834 [Tanacetum coccineum]
MIKYAFGDDEEYVAIKEDEYDDLTSTRKDACRAYQEIVRMMDEGWMFVNSGRVCNYLGKSFNLWDDWEVDRYERNANLVIIEYLVKISKKARILELKQRYCLSRIHQGRYLVSIKEDTAYLCLHSPKTIKETRSNTSYPEEGNTPYSSYMEIKYSGRYQTWVEESLNVRFNESPPPKSLPLVDDDIIESQIIENQIEDIEIKENEQLNKEIINIKETKDHPIDSVIEPKNVKESIQDESWTMAMQEELNQFKTNDAWSLVPPPDNQTRACKNILDENGVVSRNKARLVAQAYNQQEGIDFNEIYAPETMSIAKAQAVYAHSWDVASHRGSL